MVPINSNIIHRVYESFLTQEECAHISNILLRDEEQILNIPNPDRDTKPYQGLTSQHMVYNWLYHPDIEPLNIPQRLLDLDIFQDNNQLNIQCWGNILHQGQNIPLHQHHGDESEDTTLDARIHHEKAPLYALNIFLDGNTPCYTHYEDTGKTLNIIGDLHLVGAYLRHEVKTNINRQPRISLAMDVFFDDFEDTERWGFHLHERFFTYRRNNV